MNRLACALAGLVAGVITVAIVWMPEAEPDDVEFRERYTRIAQEEAPPVTRQLRVIEAALKEIEHNLLQQIAERNTVILAHSEATAP